MDKKDYRPGDRVAVYNCEGRWFGTVGSVLPADLYEIRPDTSADYEGYVAHRQQLRRLRPKPKREAFESIYWKPITTRPTDGRLILVCQETRHGKWGVR